MDVFVDLFHRGHLHDLIDRLFNHWACVIGDDVRSDEMFVKRHVRNELQCPLLGVHMRVVLDGIGHLSHLGGSRNPLVIALIPTVNAEK